MGVGGRRPEKQLVWGVVLARPAWTAIKEISGSREGVGSELWRDVFVEEQRVETVGESTNDALGTTILLGGVGTGEL